MLFLQFLHNTVIFVISAVFALHGYFCYFCSFALHGYFCYFCSFCRTWLFLLFMQSLHNTFIFVFFSAVFAEHSYFCYFWSVCRTRLFLLFLQCLQNTVIFFISAVFAEHDYFCYFCGLKIGVVSSYEDRKRKKTFQRSKKKKYCSLTISRKLDSIFEGFQAFKKKI